MDLVRSLGGGGAAHSAGGRAPPVAAELDGSGDAEDSGELGKRLGGGSGIKVGRTWHRTQRRTCGHRAQQKLLRSRQDRTGARVRDVHFHSSSSGDIRAAHYIVRRKQSTCAHKDHTRGVPNVWLGTRVPVSSVPLKQTRITTRSPHLTAHGPIDKAGPRSRLKSSVSPETACGCFS